MKKCVLPLIFAIVLLFFSSCDQKSIPMPAPEILYAELSSLCDTGTSANVGAAFLEANTGITPDEYESAVYYIAENTGAEEIIIVLCRDSLSADSVEGKLNEWLSYRQKSAEKYHTEYQEILNTAVIRRDGLTVSLLATSAINEVAEIYKKYE